MPFANRPGARIHYTVEGQGEPLLLISGLGAQAIEWPRAFVVALAQCFSVVRIENRGIGRSLCAVADWTLKDMADDVCGVMDSLGYTSAHILGISMGGMIAQRIALDYPERVRRLVLMATAFGGRETLPPEPRGMAMLSGFPGVPVGEARRRSLTAITAEGFAEGHPDVIDELARLREITPTPAQVFSTQFRAIVGDDRSSSVRDIARPTLVVHGQSDPLIPSQNGVMLAQRIAGAKLCLLEGCGHLPHIEKPRETTDVVLEFLAEAS